MDNQVVIRFEEVPHGRPIKNFVRSHLDEWLASKRFFEKQNGVVRVEFFRAPMKHMVGCYIEIFQGASYWRNFEYGKGIQDAFGKCLKHLAENTRLEQSA